MMGLQPRDPATVAIIQARMDSTRLPGKVLADIGGQPMLYRVVVRARRAQSLGQVVVATTVDLSDDPVAEFCQMRGFPCYRGDPVDVLDRFYQAAKCFNARTVIRLTGDCPLIDPGEIDRIVQAFFGADVDFAANRLPPPWKRTSPIGLDTEVVRFTALARAWREADAKFEREHVMPYFYAEDGRFNIMLVDHDRDLGYLRLTVDTEEDLTLIRQIYAHFNDSDTFGLEEILRLFETKPELMQINADVSHKSFTDVDSRY